MNNETPNKTYRGIVFFLAVVISIATYVAEMKVFYSILIAWLFFRNLIPLCLEKIRNIAFEKLLSVTGEKKLQELELTKEFALFVERLRAVNGRIVVISLVVLIPFCFIVSHFLVSDGIFIKSLFFTTLIFITFKMEDSLKIERTRFNEKIKKLTHNA